jgi:serine protease Do
MRFNLNENTKKILLISAAASVFTSVLTVFTMRALSPSREVQAQSGSARFTNLSDLMLSGAAQRQFLSSSPTNFIAAAEHITPSVVNIKALMKTESEGFWNGGDVGASSGSGVIISDDGYIVTNNHVVTEATDIMVTLDDRSEYSAKIVGTDPMTDLAVLKIEGKNLKAARLGNSDSIRVGEWVLAVGNPFNLESTVTAGIVSAKGRSINILEDAYSIESFIQTDAAVNPGNSGGALVNSNGELVGINTAIITKSGRYEGYSFAIPANLAMKVIRDLISFGVVQRGFLGVKITDLNTGIVKELGYSSMNGVYVTDVDVNSAAADAGILKGDVVVSIDGMKVKNKAELLELVARHRPGDAINLEFVRKNQRQQAKVTLKNQSNTTALLSPEKFDGNYENFKRVGINEIRPLNAQESRKLGVKGVKVMGIEKGSRIDRTNMEIGFIITHINDRKVESLEQAVKILEENKGKVVLEGIYEEYPDAYYYTFLK